MTNNEIAQELESKSIADLVDIANLTTDLIIDNWSETNQNDLQTALNAPTTCGVDVSAICNRKKAPQS